MPGIERHRFVDNIGEELLCPICSLVFNYTTTLEDCIGHAFCSDCISSWLEVNSYSPIDGSYLDKTKIKPLNTMSKSIVRGLIIRCSYVNNGCSKTCMLEFLQDHEKKCEFKYVKCYVCDSMVNFAERNDHDCFTGFVNVKKRLKAETQTLKEEITKLKLVNDKLCADRNELVAKHGIDNLPAAPLGLEYLYTALDTEYDTKFITDKIKSIGEKRINIKKVAEYGCKFAVNYYLVVSRDARKSDTSLYHGEFLLYNPSGSLESKMKSDHLRFNDEIAITDNMILHLCISNETIQLTSYDFKFNKLNYYERAIFQSTKNIYKIAYVNHRIYLKFQFYANDGINKYVYMNFLLDCRLREIHSDYSESTKEINDICTRNDFTVLYSQIDADTHEFQIKSRLNNDNIKTFMLKISSNIRIELGPNDELYVLNMNESRLEEYNLYGHLVRKTDLSIMTKLQYPKLCVSANHHFLMGGCCNNDGILYSSL